MQSPHSTNKSGFIAGVNQIEASQRQATAIELDAAILSSGRSKGQPTGRESSNNEAINSDISHLNKYRTIGDSFKSRVVMDSRFDIPKSQDKVQRAVPTIAVDPLIKGPMSFKVNILERTN